MGLKIGVSLANTTLLIVIRNTLYKNELTFFRGCFFYHDPFAISN